MERHYLTYTRNTVENSILGHVSVAIVINGLVVFLRDQNPLVVSELGSHISSAPSPEAMLSPVTPLRWHGLRDRVRFNAARVLRLLLQDGETMNTLIATVL